MDWKEFFRPTAEKKFFFFIASASLIVVFLLFLTVANNIWSSYTTSCFGPTKQIKQPYDIIPAIYMVFLIAISPFFIVGLYLMSNFSSIGWALGFLGIALNLAYIYTLGCIGSRTFQDRFTRGNMIIVVAVLMLGAFTIQYLPKEKIGSPCFCNNRMKIACAQMSDGRTFTEEAWEELAPGCIRGGFPLPTEDECLNSADR